MNHMNGLQPTTIVYPNIKGQVIIPKRLREEMDIDENTPLAPVREAGRLVYVPVDKFQPRPEPHHVIEKTEIYQGWKRIQGVWADDKSWPAVRKQRREIELEASRRRMKGW